MGKPLLCGTVWLSVIPSPVLGLRERVKPPSGEVGMHRAHGIELGVTRGDGRGGEFRGRFGLQGEGDTNFMAQESLGSWRKVSHIPTTKKTYNFFGGYGWFALDTIDMTLSSRQCHEPHIRHQPFPSSKDVGIGAACRAFLRRLLTRGGSISASQTYDLQLT